MKKLLNVNKFVYVLIFSLIIMFLLTIIILVNTKIEKSESFILQVHSNGNTNIIAEPNIARKLQEAEQLYANIGGINYKISIDHIEISQNNDYIITLKGIQNLLPGEKLRVSVIYGYQSLLHSLISYDV